MGVELAGKTLGVVGCGNIGSIVCDRAHGLRMKVLAYDPFLSPDRADDLGVEKVELDALLQRSDIISMHAPGTKDAHHLMKEQHFRRMKKTSLFVNTGRGSTVDEAAMIKALQEGRLGWAALDVFDSPPGELLDAHL